MRDSLVKVLLTASPFRPSFSPPLSMFSQPSNPCGQPRSVSLAVSWYCALLNSLAALFATPILCFQQLARSFAKTPGVGVPRNVGFHRPRVTGHQSRLCPPFVFMTLRIAFPGSALFSQRSELPGGVPLCGRPYVGGEENVKHDCHSPI